MDMAWPEAGLHLVAAGAYLIIELYPQRHPAPAATPATVLVADLDQAIADAVARGAAVKQPPFAAPVDAGARQSLRTYRGGSARGTEGSGPGPAFWT